MPKLKKSKESSSNCQPLVVIVADAHLRLRTWTTHPTLQRDSFFAFSQAVDYALAHSSVQQFILLGDNTDINGDPPDSVSAVLQFLRQQFDRLAEQSIPVAYINAQHDMTSPSWEAAIHSAPTHISGALQVSGRRCYAMDYTHSDKLAAAVAQIPADTEWVFCHQVWQEFVGPQIPADASFDVFKKLKKLEFVFTGDFHQAVAWDGGQFTAVSPGSGCLQEVSEPPEKSFLVLMEEAGTGRIHLHREKVKTRPIYRWRDVATEEKLASILEQLHAVALQPDDESLWEDIRKPIVSIRYSTELTEAKQRLETELGNDFHLFLKPLGGVDSGPVLTGAANDKMLDGGLQGCLSKLCHDQTSIEYRLLQRALAQTQSSPLRGRELRTKLLETVREMRTELLCG